MRGTPYLFIWRHTVSDCGCTPLTAQNSAQALSSTRRLRSTSIVKSTCPGVSMMLMRYSGNWLSIPFQKQVVAAAVIVMPRSCFLLHVVHDGRAVVHLADLVRDAGVEQDALGGRGLAGVNVRRDADVPVALDRCSAWHDEIPRTVVGQAAGPYQR